MTIVINGTTGISGVDGSAGTPAVQGTDTNTGVFFPTADTIAFTTGGTEDMRIDSSGNVGIGTSSPDYKLTIQNSDAAITLKDAGGTTRAYIGVAGAIGTAPTGALRLRSDQGGFVYGYQGTEQMRIDSSGNVGIGTTSTLGNSVLNVLTGITARTAAASGVTPYFQSYNGNAGADLKTWRFGTQSTGNLIFETVNDAYSSSTSRMNLDSSGNLQFNSGYGSVATAYGCRAWVNFNGTGTVAIRASGNVTSITDNGVGDYTINFTNAISDANYSTVGMSSTKSGTEGQSLMLIEWTTVPATTAVRITTVARGTGSAQDNTYNNVAIFR